MELQLYMPAGIAMLMAVGFCCLFWLIARKVGRRPRLTHEKNMPFECGSDPIGSPRGRYSVKFYQVAILFLVFDIEAAFMYPWAVVYGKAPTEGGFSLSFPSIAQNPNFVSAFGFVEMLVFVAILVVALAYVWRKKAIGWD